MSAQELKAELVADVRADLAEGPVWDTRDERLYFVDILAGRLHAIDPSSGARAMLETGAMVGCAAPRRSGGWIAALPDGLWSVDFETGTKAFLRAAPGLDPSRARFNDGKCDPQGRLWAGTMGLKSERGAGTLYCFTADGEAQEAVREVSVSNGLAWAPEGRAMYYIDSPTRRVDRFDFEPATGEIRNRRPAIALPVGSDLPDGCTIDAEGMLWIARWGGGCVTRWDPATGKMLATIRVPAPHTTSCAFGGPKHDTLFITTARRGLSAGQLMEFPESGGIFACRPGPIGLPAVAFGG